MTPRSYCVVGGGISGLTSAYRLRQAVGDDATITLFEPADRLGGVLRTEHIGGQPMDLGAEAFVLRRPEMPALLAELGLSDRQLASTGARPLIYSQQRLHPLPPQTVVGIPSSAGSMAGLVDDATLARIDAEAARPFTWQVGSDPAVADLVADRFGDRVVARSVDPLLSGVYAGSAATIGLRAAAPSVAAALDRGATSVTDAVRQALPPGSGGPVFGALDGGYQVLLDGLVRRSRVHWVRARVVQLERGWVLRDETGGRWQADAVILAVPAPRLARLVDGIAPRTHAAARQIVSASSAVVALAVPGGTAFPHCSGVLVAGDESPHAKAITLSSRKWGSARRRRAVRLSFGRFRRRTGPD
ncbi:LOW QUALITY PROTEIN: protoporphyrinogen oxidase hemY, partial [Mycobacterium tuberculosis T17]